MGPVAYIQGETPSAERSSADWTQAIRAGDVRAFEAFFRQTAPGLRAFLTRYLRSRSDAEEVIQEVFSALWTRRERLFVRESLTTYVYTAARNRALNLMRRERRRAKLSADEMPQPDAIIPDVSEALAERELAQALRTAVNRLPPRCREIFTLSRRDRLTHPQIASALGLSVKALEKQIGRALNALRRDLETDL
jgi:RNA polymerase sigma-70 factor (ECF subfamily)